MRARSSVVVLVLVLAIAGCASGHATPGFGQARREAFAMQRAAPPKASPPANGVLDTQEAQVISQGYVRSLSGKGTESSTPAPILLISPDRQGQQQGQLPPSVPRQ
jgi:hypothetical protein